VLAVLVAIRGGPVWGLWPRSVLRVEPASLILRPGDEAGKSVVVFAPTSAVLEAVGVPAGITIQRDSANFRLTADLNAQPGPRTLAFRSGSGSGARTVRLPIEIDRPEVTLPQPPTWFTPSNGAKLVRFAGRNYPDRIARVFEDGTRVEFLLIPRKHGREVVEAFYIMEDKVWNGLYGRMIEEKGGKIHPPGGPSRDDWPRLPVMKIPADQAAKFATWLAGPDANLPTRAQWDLAAGLEDGTSKTGSIARDPTRVAVGRESSDGPLPVGSAAGDRSLFGCHDMAGNGMEWTRDRTDVGEIYLRGRSFDESPPLTFEDLEFSGSMLPNPDPPNPYIGFRVVIDIKP